MSEFSNITRGQVAVVAALARNLVAANERRNPTSEHATLAEEDALFNLSWELTRLRDAARKQVA